MSYLCDLELKESDLVKFFNFLTGKRIDEMDLQFALDEYDADTHRGITLDSFMINAGVAPRPNEINPNVRSLLPQGISEEGLLLISKCLSFFPTKRPSFEQLLTSEWFKENGIKLNHEMALRANGGFDKERVTKEGVVIGSRMGYKEKTEGYQ
eukprot:gnl/Chilomastix_caulleri/1237.p1 GENE.gnl/Chilomastix_caulleri/1237~~gnl/Chilomastix_caulleri/1237.p1  ORF type:complete len:153 (+),score=50.96 gnl/Chilomastix_caulleri/1237:65-523(+)